MTVIVLIHSVENILCSFLSSISGFHSTCSQHIIDSLHNLSHLILINNSITIYVIHPEGPFQLLLRGASGCHVNRQQELPEVNEPILVGVEGSEHVVTELLGVARGEEELVHVNKLGRGQPAVGAVLLEPFVPFLYRVLVVASVAFQKVKIFLGESLLALDTAHLFMLSIGNVFRDRGWLRVVFYNTQDHTLYFSQICHTIN